RFPAAVRIVHAGVGGVARALARQRGQAGQRAARAPTCRASCTRPFEGRLATGCESRPGCVGVDAGRSGNRRATGGWGFRPAAAERV
ncbi:MAG: hypothetical protein KJZ87_22195, partial [Thermoguttaceae bacterium]|nr:hypothetical protein [Thermoguttaceae bacterium]